MDEEENRLQGDRQATASQNWEGDSHQVATTDSAAAIAHALEECQSARRLYLEYKELFDEFEEVDVPAFRSWFHQQFQEHSGELSRRQLEYQELTRKFSRIEFLRLEMDSTYFEAYEKYAEYEQSGDAFFQDFFAPVDADGNPGTLKFRSDALRKKFDSLVDTFLMKLIVFIEGKDFVRDDPEYLAFKKQVQEELGLDDENHPLRQLGTQDEATANIQRSTVKGVYRKLANRLHPDRTGDAHNEQKAERWLEVQAAYEEEDLDKLKQLQILCSVDEQGSMDNLDYSELKELSAHFRKAIDDYDERMSELQFSPMWQFTRKENYYDEMKADLEEEICAEMEKMSETIVEKREMIEKWSKAPEEETISFDDLVKEATANVAQRQKFSGYRKKRF